MPALPGTRDTLWGLATKTTQSIASVNAVLRRALARLINGEQDAGPKRRTR